MRKADVDIGNVNEPIRRLIIKKLVLRNFKSYGGTTTIGPFHKRFTSIVGPNGSGKSNVIDAMLFVFGFRAKQMRFEKLSELIHNSCAYLDMNNGHPIESMKVSIHFCEILDHNPDIDEFEAIEGSELIISREVFKDNSSEYRINGLPATRKQVSNSLKNFGMDLCNNRFLILQGEVEQISQMKPKATKPEEEGLLEYLEDIIGTNKYLECIKEARIECEALQDQYQEHFSRTRVAQREVEDLMEPKDEADKYIAKEKALYKAMAILAQKLIETVSDELKTKVEELQKLEKESRDLNAEMESVIKEGSEAASKIKLVEQELDKSQKKQKNLSDSFQKMCSMDECLRKQLLREIKKIEEKTASIKILNAKKPKYEQNANERLLKAEEFTKGIPDVQIELDSAESELERLIEDLKPEIDAASEELANREAKLAPIQHSYDEVNKEISLTEASIDLMTSQKNEAESTLLGLRESERVLKESIKANEKALKEQEADLISLKNEYESNAGKMNKLEESLHKKSHLCMKLKGKYEFMKRELEDVKNSKDQYGYIMGLVSSSCLKGLHGRLSDLGLIPPQYEKAFVAAGGSNMDVLVVDTPEVASQIFDELRKRNLGRISAVALSVLNNNLQENMEKSEKTSLEGLPFSVQKLIDLVRPNNPKYKICFYYAIRDTLLARNLDEATKIGYGYRKRVVTIEGELVEPDGRMCGGGIKKAVTTGSKANGISKNNDTFGKDVVNPRALEELKQYLHQNNAELDHFKADLSKLNEIQLSINRKIHELGYSTDLLRQTVKNEEVQLDEQIQKVRAASLAFSSEGQKQLGKFKDLLNEKIRNREVIKAELKEHESIVADAYRTLENVGEGKLKVAKNRMAKIEIKLGNMRKELERLRKEAANFLADAEKCVHDVSKNEKEIEQHKRREKDLEKQLDSLEEEASRVNDELDRANRSIEEHKKSLRDLDTIVAEKNKIIEEQELKNIDMKHNIDKLKKEVGSMEHFLKEQHASLKNTMKLYNNTLKLIQKSQEANELLNSKNIAEKIDMVILDDDEITAGNNTEAQTETTTGRNESKVESLSDEELKMSTVDDLNAIIEKLSRGAKNIPNLAVIDSFRLKVREYNKKKMELQVVQNKLEEAKKIHDQFCLKRKNEFLFNFAVIAKKLKEMYQAITLGGDAELELLDSTDPFTEGILFSVRPANKSWKQIQNLSGGEKTLSSLALVFALHHYKPNPIYFMDEIDAALDFRNVSIIAQNIKERAKDAQFIVISLRNQMFELCNQMVGIYKTFDVTKTACISPAAFSMSKHKLDKDSEGKSTL